MFFLVVILKSYHEYEFYLITICISDKWSLKRVGSSQKSPKLLEGNIKLIFTFWKWN